MKLYEGDEYRATKDWPFSVGSGCVVYRKINDEVEVLVLVRKAGEFPDLIGADKDSYHLPKGHVGRDETLEQTALRETLEEAGCEAEIQTYLGGKLNQYVDVGIPRDKFIHYFAASWTKDIDVLDHDHTGKIWLTVDGAISKIKGANPKHEDEILERFKKYLELTSES